MSSKWHGPKIHPIYCIGVEVVGKDSGKTTTIYAEEHEKVRLVHAADRHQVKRCVACQKLFSKQRNKVSTNPKKGLKKLVEAMRQAEAILSDASIADNLSSDDRIYLEEVVEKGKEAEEALNQ